MFMTSSDRVSWSKWTRLGVIAKGHYQETTDDGKTWHTATGVELSLPLSQITNAALVHDYYGTTATRARHPVVALFEGERLAVGELEVSPERKEWFDERLPTVYKTSSLRRRLRPIRRLARRPASCHSGFQALESLGS